MKTNANFTQEQVDILLLKQKTDYFEGTISRIDQTFNRIEAKIQSHFNWTMGAIFGLYGITLTALIGIIIKTYWK